MLSAFAEIKFNTNMQEGPYKYIEYTDVTSDDTPVNYYQDEIFNMVIELRTAVTHLNITLDYLKTLTYAEFIEHRSMLIKAQHEIKLEELASNKRKKKG